MKQKDYVVERGFLWTRREEYVRIVVGGFLSFLPTHTVKSASLTHATKWPTKKFYSIQKVPISSIVWINELILKWKKKSILNNSSK